MDPIGAVGLENAEFCSEGVCGCGLPGKGFGTLLSAPSTDNVCPSWALLELFLAFLTAPALSDRGVRHGNTCRGTSLKKRAAVQVFRPQFEF